MRELMFAIIFVSLLLSTYAHAANWKPYSSPKASDTYYDVDTVKIYKDGTIDVWEKVRYPLRAAQKMRQHRTQYRRYSYSLDLRRYDCSEGKFTTMEVYDYDTADNLIGQDITKRETYDEHDNLIESVTGPVAWFRIIPDSKDEGKAKELCSIWQQSTEQTKSRHRSNKHR